MEQHEERFFILFLWRRFNIILFFWKLTFLICYVDETYGWNSVRWGTFEVSCTLKAASLRLDEGGSEDLVSFIEAIPDGAIDSWI